MKHPFSWIPEPAQRPVWIGSLISTLVVSSAMLILNGPLKTDAAPTGIVSLQLAWSLPDAKVMLASWGETGLVYAALGLGLDYLYLLLYACTIGLGCVMVARNLSARGQFLFQLGTILSWGLIVAALLDGVENYALIRLLLGNERSVWPMLAVYCAVPKFAFILLGATYVLVGALAVWGKRLKRKV